MTDPWGAPARRLPRLHAWYLIVFGCLAGSTGQGAALQVGQLVLQACGTHHAYCGTLERPLDAADASVGRLAVHFEFYRHRAAGAAQGTLVATEGGPGYPATLSRDAYLALFGPLLDTRDLLLMDNRGTGQSDAVDCPSLQQAARATIDLNGACGTALGARAPLYSTAYAADDLAALLAALGIAHIDLYGDSYGTFFEQVFALRHPALLRSIVLDGAYPVSGEDYAWYPSYAPAMRDKFERLCQRSPPCARLPGTSIDRANAVLEQLRAHPFDAEGYDGEGRRRRFRADASMLATVMFASAPALITAREFDAAARAFVAGDRVPLLRLMAETTGATDSRDPSGDPAQFSAGLAIAVMCQDAPQIFDLRQPLPARRIEHERALARRAAQAPDTYAPFSIDEYRGLPLDYAYLDQCLAWPPVPASHPPAQVAPPHAAYPAVPALILSGDLDDITTPQDGAAVAAAFPLGHQVLLVNSFHVNALPHARSACGAQLARRFIQTLAVGDARCAEAIPPLRLVSRFVRHADEIDPLQPEAGNRASVPLLRLAAVALETAADALARAAATSAAHGMGLRGGQFELAGRRLRLQRMYWSEDVCVSGKIEWTAGRRAAVTARVQVQGSTQGGNLTMRWIGGGGSDLARLRGRLGGVVLAARAPAP